MTIRFLVVVLWPAILFSDCQMVTGSRILARDFAQILPAFARVKPDLPIGFAPPAGSRREYRGPDMQRLAARLGISVDPALHVCFTSPVETLSRDRIAAAIHVLLPAAAVEVIEFTRQPVPSGELRFSVSDLPRHVSSDSLASIRWRGVICSPGRADFPVWAVVRIRVDTTCVAAEESLRPGLPIERRQLSERRCEGPPGLPEISGIVGRSPRKTIAAGTIIEAGLLDEREDVTRGQRVAVDVLCGRTRLMLEGRAQSSGRRGDLIAIRNPATGRIFQARVTAEARVTVVPGARVAGVD
ncbi:MAG: flagellar basal body P-ring formation chaperone FlgA [Bryobacteraceae bacterium]